MNDALKLVIVQVGLILTALFSRTVEWSRANRLRTRIKRDHELLQLLQSGSTEHQLLAEHVAREVRFLAKTSLDEERFITESKAFDGFVSNFFLPAFIGILGIPVIVLALWNYDQSLSYRQQWGYASVGLIGVVLGTLNTHRSALRRYRTVRKEQREKSDC